MKSRILNSLIVAATIVLGLLVAGRYLLFPNKAALMEMNKRCRQLKRGVTLGELARQFGKAEHRTDTGSDRHLFGSHEYSVLYSDYIVAYVDEKGEVVSLSCGERQKVVW